MVATAPETRPAPDLGAVCKHDHLARQCGRCDDEHDLNRALHLLWRVRDWVAGVAGADLPICDIIAYLDEMGTGKAPPVSIYSKGATVDSGVGASARVTSLPFGGTTG